MHNVPRQALEKNVPKLLGAMLSVIWILCGVHAAKAEVRDIVFPVIGDTRFSDDFGDPRSGGRTHEGNDILGTKLQPLVAAVDGMVRFVAWPEPEYGYLVSLEDSEGYEYWYLHINNDTPGTDDGRGGGRNAYAPYMQRPFPVVAGQLIGWMGDSGNAESTSPHLHFEIHRPDGTIINPYESLTQATHIASPVTPPPMPGEIVPYGEFRGGASVAAGEFDGNAATRELITAAGPGGGPHVRIFSEDGELLKQFMVFHTDFRGGVDVASGDVDADGIDEIIVVPLSSANPIVRVYSYNGVLLSEFFAYAESFKKGLRIAAADLNGDGIAEIVTGAGPGGGPHVRVFRPDGTVINQFFAYAQGFRGGVDVAAAPRTAGSEAMIVTGAGPGAGPHVRVFTPQGVPVSHFFPYALSFKGGVRVSLGNAIGEEDSPPEIATAPASSGGPDFRLFSRTGTLLALPDAFERWWSGGYDIAIAGEDTVHVSSAEGGRRASVWVLD